MIKGLLLAGIFVLGLFSVASAADKVLEWQESVGATGYKIEISVDSGVTWTELPTPTYTTVTWTAAATGEVKNISSTTITVPDNVLVLARIGAYKGTSVVAWRFESGAWHNSAWEPVVAATGLGVQ